MATSRCANARALLGLFAWQNTPVSPHFAQADRMKREDRLTEIHHLIEASNVGWVETVEYATQKGQEINQLETDLAE